MGQVIRNARIAKMMTQVSLAEKIEVSHRTIYAIENGKCNPSFDVLYRIIQALDIPADLIFHPNVTANTHEQEQFMREYLNATDVEQRVAMTTARSAWFELRLKNE